MKSSYNGFLDHVVGFFLCFRYGLLCFSLAFFLEFGEVVIFGHQKRTITFGDQWMVCEVGCIVSFAGFVVFAEEWVKKQFPGAFGEMTKPSKAHLKDVSLRGTCCRFTNRILLSTVIQQNLFSTQRPKRPKNLPTTYDDLRSLCTGTIDPGG